MKKLILFLTLLIVGFGDNLDAVAQYSPSNNLNYIKLLKAPPIGSVEDSVMVFDGSDSFVKMVPKSSVVAGKENVSNKTSTITNYSETLYPNEKAVHDGLNMKLNISDLPTNLTLYPTTTASDIGGYVVMVTDIHDVRYDDPAVDVSTPTITTTDQLVSQRISDAGVLIGQPGVFNITTFGNIRRLSGTGTATFYFRVYHRDAAGVETLIGQSSNSGIVSSSSYIEFTAAMVWDDGDFVATDRIVIKTYANRIPGNSDPVYQFQFGGMMPVRTLLPVPFSVVDAGYEVKTNKQNSLALDGTGVKFPTVDAVNAALPKNYSKVVYVNTTSPITATIFDDENPPITNDDLLKNDVNNLYIGTDASTWVYNSSTYVTKIVPATSNFFIEYTSIDAGNDKNSNLYRNGAASFGSFLRSNRALVVDRGASDTSTIGSHLRLMDSASTSGGMLQLNASNGIDLWNYASGVWNKRFTFSSAGDLTAKTYNFAGTTISEPENASSYTQVKIQPTDGDKDAVFQFAPSGTATNSVLEFYSSPTLTGMNRGIIKNQNGNLQFGSDGANMPISFIMSGVPKVNIASDGTVSATNYTGSATLTGTPTAPTAPVGTNTTQVATTAFVQTSTASVASAVYGSDVSLSSGQSPYTLQLSDANARLTTNGTFNQNYSIVIPTNSVIPFQVGTKIRINTSSSPGNTTLSGVGITFLGANLQLRYGGSFNLTKVATDTWFVEHANIVQANSAGKIASASDLIFSGGFEGTFNGNLAVSKFPVYTVATLPSTSPLAVTGNMAYVTDATAPTYLGTLTGGGTVVCPVFYNGTAWVSH